MLHTQAVFVVSGAEFTGHRVQAAGIVDPTGEIESASQPIHTMFPGAGLYVPAAHCRQVPESKVCPMLHKQTVFKVFGAEFTAHWVQADTTVDPTNEIKFALQSIHIALPGAFLYVPPGHAEQLAAFPVYPMLHKQAVFAVSGVEFTGHRVQAAAAVDPTGEIESALQPVHAAFPGTCLYLPGAHCKQVANSKVYPILHRQAIFVVSGAEFTAH